MPRQLNQYLHFGRYLARRFLEDNCIKNAAALTYTTLFAVVPVMTVAYAMLAAIPAFDQVGGQVEARAGDGQGEPDIPVQSGEG